MEVADMDRKRVEISRGRVVSGCHDPSADRAALISAVCETDTAVCGRAACVQEAKAGRVTGLR